MIVTGGADGADAMWSQLSKRPVRVISFYGHVVSKQCKGEIVRVPQKELDEKNREFIRVAGLLNRSVHGGAYMHNLLRRNFFIVEDADAVFAIGYLKKGKVDGGTAWGIEYFCWKHPDRPAFLFDQTTVKWYERRGTREWFLIEPPHVRDFEKAACIGSRDLTEAGIAAIMEAV